MSLSPAFTYNELYTKELKIAKLFSCVDLGKLLGFLRPVFSSAERNIYLLNLLSQGEFYVLKIECNRSARH